MAIRVSTRVRTTPITTASENMYFATTFHWNPFLVTMAWIAIAARTRRIATVTQRP